MQVKKQQLEPDVEEWTGSKLAQEYNKAVYCHLAYLTYMLSLSFKMPGWMNHKLESRSPRRNINNLVYAYDTTLMAENEVELKGLWMKVKKESEKAGLKLNIQKTKVTASGTTTPWQAEGGKSGNCDRFYFLGLQTHCGH